jgi:hypothetical protein
MANSINNIPTYTDNAFEISRIELQSNSGGKPIDLMEIYTEIVIFESIFDNKMIGEIVIRDALNYAETLPIVGNESIHIEYKTKGVICDTVTIKGKVFAPLGKSRTSNEKTEVYKMQFVSDLQFYNRMLRVNTSYEGQITSIASKMFIDQFGDQNSNKLMFNETSIGQHKFVFPYWTPIFALSWLSQRAYCNNPSCFVFYEDVDGFHFKNLLKAIEADPKYTYRVEPKNAYNQGTVEGFLTKVQDYSITSFFDRLEEYGSGMYAGGLLTHNITTKEYEPYTFNYGDSFLNSRHLNQYPLFPQKTTLGDKLNSASSGFRNVLPVQYRKFNSILDNEKPDRYFLQRSSIQKQFTTLRVTMTVPGNSSLRLLDVLNFELPKSGYLENAESDWQDKYLSGKYIIVSMKTIINKGSGYNTVVEMSKDSLVEGIPSKFEGSSEGRI